ncbi:MAG TPA: GYD domain-containing protein [Chloroflexota bacterium]|nr:GYD domain-containing protein [Chloroflexota bacterium]
MPKFLLEVSYTAEGAKGLAKEGGTSRRKMVTDMVKGVNGTVEAFYYAFGAADVFVIADVPDAVTAAGLSLAVNQSGAAHIRTHLLMTPEEMDQAAKKAVGYRPPGK